VENQLWSDCHHASETLVSYGCRVVRSSRIRQIHMDKVYGLNKDRTSAIAWPALFRLYIVGTASDPPVANLPPPVVQHDPGA
jgi:hypothetical protein